MTELISEDVINFQLNMIKDDPDVTIDNISIEGFIKRIIIYCILYTEDNISIEGFIKRIIIYTNDYKGLIDKHMHIWIISGDTVFQFSLKHQIRYYLMHIILLQWK